MRQAIKTLPSWSLLPLSRASTPSRVWISSCWSNTTKASSACLPAWRVRSRRRSCPAITSAPRLPPCGIATSLVRAITTLNCRITGWKRITLCCPSSSSWHGRPASLWQPPTTPTTCARRMLRCRRFCSASRPEKPCRMPTVWSSRLTNSTLKQRMRCTICLPWCRMPVPTHRSLPTSAILILSLATPKFRIIRPPAAWTTRRSLKSSAGRVWSAATVPMCRRPTKTA